MEKMQGIRVRSVVFLGMYLVMIGVLELNVLGDEMLPFARNALTAAAASSHVSRPAPAVVGPHALAFVEAPGPTRNNPRFPRISFHTTPLYAKAPKRGEVQRQNIDAALDNRDLRAVRNEVRKTLRASPNDNVVERKNAKNVKLPTLPSITYKLDSYGRVIEVTGKLRRWNGEGERDAEDIVQIRPACKRLYTKLMSQHDKVEYETHCGHLVAHSICMEATGKRCDDPVNLVPMESSANRDLFRAFEAEVLKALRKNAEVEIDIHISYPKWYQLWQRGVYVPNELTYKYRAKFPKTGWQKWVPFIPPATSSKKHGFKNSK